MSFQGNVPDLQSDGKLSSTLPGEEYKYYIKKIIKRKWKNSVKNKNEVPSNETGPKEAKHENM